MTPQGCVAVFMGVHSGYQGKVGGGDEDKSPRCAASAFCVLACASAQKHQNENVLNLRFKWLVKPKSILLQRNQHVGPPLVQNGNNMRGACRLLLRQLRELWKQVTSNMIGQQAKLHLYTFDWLRFPVFPSLDMPGQVQARLDMFGGGYRNCPSLVIAEMLWDLPRPCSPFSRCQRSS